ncbi:hypothetical protein [Leifsonia williamsii]|uniref:hypothetical protein n=1 Tax=Leifsonia williamsii TaxID=3035919 RepID=UPI00263BC390|nr:hypothetical protein [Leifsonia williamsii]
MNRTNESQAADHFHRIDYDPSEPNGALVWALVVCTGLGFGAVALVIISAGYGVAHLLGWL